jgi:hypothetical protein
MHIEERPQRLSHRHSAAIRNGYWQRLQSADGDVAGDERLEALVRSLARDARTAGVPAERAIVMLKVSVHGSHPMLGPHLATVEEQRQYRLFEALLALVLDEYFGECAPGPVRGRLAS